MNSYFYKTSYYESDYWGHIPTAHLLRLAMHAIMLQTEAEGLPSEAMRGELGAVWMLARARFYQSAPIYPEGELELRVSRRSIDRGTYARAIGFYDGGKHSARCELASTAVSLERRRIMKPAAVEEFWKNPQEPENSLRVPKLRPGDGLPWISDYAVSYRDCDDNRHFNSSNYIDLVSELGGFYEGEPKIMEYLQIDFNSEALPGQTLVLRGRTQKDSGVICGVHVKGNVCFCSEYRMKIVDF